MRVRWSDPDGQRIEIGTGDDTVIIRIANGTAFGREHAVQTVREFGSLKTVRSRNAASLPSWPGSETTSHGT